MTTAAIGASRYDAPNAGSMLMRSAPSRTAATAVQRARGGVRERDVRPDAQPGHPRGSGLAPTAWKRRPAAV